MFKKTFTKLSFFVVLLFGLCVFSGCGSQTTVVPASQSNNILTTYQQKQKQAQIQVNTRTRAS